MDIIKNISLEGYQKLPLKSFEGKIIVIDTLESFKQHIDDIENITCFGFDTETRPSFKRGRKNKMALIQLSTDKIAYLLRINHINFPVRLIKLLTNPDILKIGSGLKEDLSGMRQYYSFEPKGFIDLQIKAKELGVEKIGLKMLAATFLNFKISKAKQLSNWENPVLTESQLSYAATDAWVCYEIYKKITNG